MRHRVSLRKLNRSTKHRKALFRNMVTQLVEHERIVTTVPKAKELRRFAEKAVSWAKEGSAFARVKARRVLRTDESVDKLFAELAPRYAHRNGGYTRILRAGWRSGDNAPLAVIEYVDREGEMRPARPVGGEAERA